MSGDAACEIVAVKKQDGQVCEISELSGDAACEIVAGETEVSEVGEVAEFCRHAAADARTRSDAGKVVDRDDLCRIQVECCDSVGFNRDTCPSVYFLSCC